MTIDANYIALSAINDAMREAIKGVTSGLESCGRLEHPENKIAEEAKSYFRQQIIERKKALDILHGIHRELNTRLWGKQPSVQNTATKGDQG